MSQTPIGDASERAAVPAPSASPASAPTDKDTTPPVYSSPGHFPKASTGVSGIVKAHSDEFARKLEVILDDFAAGLKRDLLGK